MDDVDETPPSVGGKDLKDFKDLSRAPVVAYLQKQFLPSAPRRKSVTPERAAAASPVAAPLGIVSPTVAKAAIFQELKQFARSDTLRWFLEYIRYRIGPQARVPDLCGQRARDGIYTLKSDEPDIRIGLAGDWGTGTDEAFKVATLIEQFSPHYTIHLGDVYFVGDPREVGENFLGIAKPHSRYTPCTWPKGSKGAFALNGNHEMYARGNAYFDSMLPALGEIENGRAATAEGQLLRAQE